MKVLIFSFAGVLLALAACAEFNLAEARGLSGGRERRIERREARGGCGLGLLRGGLIGRLRGGCH